MRGEEDFYYSLKHCAVCVCMLVFIPCVDNDLLHIVPDRNSKFILQHISVFDRKMEITDTLVPIKHENVDLLFSCDRRNIESFSFT